MSKPKLSQCAAKGSRLRALMKSNASVWYTRHAEREMAKDSIEKIDLENMLRRCAVTMVEDSGGEETLRAEGPDTDGRRIAAIVVCYEETVSVKIVTGWAT